MLMVNPSGRLIGKGKGSAGATVAVGGLVGVIELEAGAKAGVLQASASRPVKMRVTYLQRFTILDLRFAIGLLLSCIYSG
jgi:hypothetical protein